VNRINGKCLIRLATLAVWLLSYGSLTSWCSAQDPFSGPSQKPSFGQSVKQTFSKMGEPFSSKSRVNTVPENDATSLSTKSKPSAELYIAIAKLHEEANKPAEAEEQYQRARKENPTHLGAMLSYAHFLENQNRYEEAIDLYQLAIKTHPKDASAYNNLGLCYARKKKLKEATSALSKAIQLDRRNLLYRNNIAAILVELNRPGEAYSHLREVHGDAVAYYNLGYLLNKKGDIPAAEHHFRQALKLDPTMESAQRWLVYLHKNSSLETSEKNSNIAKKYTPAESPRPQEQVAKRIAPPHEQSSRRIALPQDTPRRNPINTQPTQIISNREISTETPPMPETWTPRRLPPTNVRQPVEPLPSTEPSDGTDTAPSAPLPPNMMAP
jgi:tetratricopeptide (TPR) repeat protein